jgi:hypothetical protein
MFETGLHQYYTKTLNKLLIHEQQISNYSVLISNTVSHLWHP